MTPANVPVAAKLGIWSFAFGYFACYVPYSALTKALSKGLVPGMDGGAVSGFTLLPVSVAASTVGMLTCLTVARWWRFAGRRELFGVVVPWPGRWTFLSGLCTAAIIATTTLSYTFSGVSIVFVMLLMRGGVLRHAFLDQLDGLADHVQAFLEIHVHVDPGIAEIVQHQRLVGSPHPHRSHHEGRRGPERQAA